MATFPRGHHARHITRPTYDATDPVTIKVKITWTTDPSDTTTLRGIPAIGRGVAGHIPGTRPDTTTLDDPRAA